MTVHVVNIPDAILSNDTNLCSQPSLSNLVVLKGAEMPGANYVWTPKTGIVGSFLSPTAKVRPAATTTYRLDIRTKEGCKYADSVTVSIHTAAKEMDAGPDQSVCQGSKGILKANGAVKYVWRPDPTLSKTDKAETEASPTSSRYYYVTMTSQYGCVFTDSVYVKVKPFAPYLAHPSLLLCAGDTMQLISYGGTTYKWSPPTDITNVNAPDPLVYPKRTTRYYLTISDTLSGCSFTDSVLVNVDTACVWPGDANRDNKVDYLDLLSLALGADSAGPRRSSILRWRGLAAKEWTGSTGQGINFKHLDCNGDGVIDAGDTITIADFYNQTHDIPKVPQQVGTAGDPELGFRFEKDTLYAGDTVRAMLFLGTAQKQIKNCYGIGWKYSYTDHFIVPNSFSFDYACDLFCGRKTEWQMYRPFNGGGEAALVQNDHKGFTGNGQLARIQYVLSDTLHANYNSKGEKIGAFVDFARAINKDGNVLGLYLQNDSAIVLPRRNVKDTLPPLVRHEFKIYPNPASHTLIIEKGDEEFESITLSNILGQEVYFSDHVPGDVITIPVSDFRPGMYFITIKTPDRAISRKVIIQR